MKIAIANAKIFFDKCVEVFNRQKVYLAEREKTEDEIIVVAHILEKMREFVESYGGTYVNYQQKHVHVTDPAQLTRNDWMQIRNRGFFDGGFLVVLQAITIMLFKRDDLITFANVTAHELLHGCAFQSVYCVWSKDDDGVMSFIDRRCGMKIAGLHHTEGVVQYFRWLDEAVTQELTERFILTYLRGLDVLKEAMELREYFLPDIDKEKLFLYGYCREKIVKGHSFTNYGIAEAYPQERNSLNYILNDIVTKMSDRFPTKEDAFALFARAYLTSHLLPVARVIDAVYGRGSFHDMALCEKKVIGWESYDLYKDH